MARIGKMVDSLFLCSLSQNIQVVRVALKQFSPFFQRRPQARFVVCSPDFIFFRVSELQFDGE